MNPHFSQDFYCGGADGHVYCVALRRAPRRTVEYVCGALGRAPCIHARLRRLATKPCEKQDFTKGVFSLSSSIKEAWNEGPNKCEMIGMPMTVRSQGNKQDCDVSNRA